jgi:dethiobiotin synthetase
MIKPMSAWGLQGILFITGTGTDVGKTIVTAAVAALAADAGHAVAVVKVAQTGVPDGPDSGPSDLETVTRLSGVTDTHELNRYPDPLSPEAAARVSGRPPVDFEHARKVINDLSVTRDLVLVEGAGGLLVRYTADGATIADLAESLDAPALVVIAAGLGTLNHTALTLEAMRERGLASAGIVIGSWPRDPGLAERENLADLRTLAGGPLAGRLPESSGKLNPAQFLAAARAGLARNLGGSHGGPALLSHFWGAGAHQE